MLLIIAYTFLPAAGGKDGDVTPVKSISELWGWGGGEAMVQSEAGLSCYGGGSAHCRRWQIPVCPQPSGKVPGVLATCKSFP